jgi:hypothetical protein
MGTVTSNGTRTASSTRGTRDRILFAQCLGVIVAFITLLGLLLTLRTETVVSCSGEIRSRDPVNIRTNRDGWLISSNVHLGDVVKVGQPLLTLRYTDGILETMVARVDGQVVDTIVDDNEHALVTAGSLIARVAPTSSLYISAAVPPRFRGKVEVGGKAKYKIGYLGEPTISKVVRFQIRQRDLGNVDYFAEVALAPSDQRPTNLGRELSVDLVAPGVRLIDYLIMR